MTVSLVFQHYHTGEMLWAQAPWFGVTESPATQDYSSIKVTCTIAVNKTASSMQPGHASKGLQPSGKLHFSLEKKNLTPNSKVTNNCQRSLRIVCNIQHRAWGPEQLLVQGPERPVQTTLRDIVLCISFISRNKLSFRSGLVREQIYCMFA